MIATRTSAFSGRSGVRSVVRQVALGVALLLLLAPAQLYAQSGKPTAIPTTPPREHTPYDRKVPLLGAPLRLDDFNGMHPSEALRDHLAAMSGFVQTNPTDGRPATEKTEVYLGYTRSTLYVAFLCFDHNPRLIRNHLARRENLLNDDNVSLLLDPLQDHRRGVLFQLNPSGVQADAAWTDNSDVDYSYDQVWDSAARVTPQGWMALFAIPFRSIRFRPGAEGWGVVLTRNFPRNSETDSWPHIATTVSGTLTQEGTLLGIEGGAGSHNVQINPYALAQSEHTLESLVPGQPFWSTRHLEGTAGGEVKAVVKDTVVLDATVNPDFSDVESDQPQFTVNQRYPVYFPELRPFFLENANYFSTPINLLYTRNIVRPEFGGRVTGKLGHTNIGLLAIDDREPGETFLPGDTDAGKRALFGVARVYRDLGKGSGIGAIYTDNEFAGSWNRIGGLDFTARFSDKWTAVGQMVESSSKGLDGRYSAGPGSWLEFTRSGHALNLNTAYKDFSTGFRSEVGFVQTTDIRGNQTHANYQWYPRHSVLQSFGLETNQQLAFDHQGNRVYHYSTYDPFFLLPRKLVFAPLFGQNSDTVGPQNGYALTANRNFTENFIGGVARGAPLRQLSFNLTFLHGGNVNYNPASGSTPSLLRQDYLQALVTVQPVRSLTIDNTYLLDRDHVDHTGADAYESQTFRTKLNYQFTRALSARVIVQYDSVLVNPAETSLVRSKQVGTQALLTWLPHPGTAIYFGYNNDIQNLDRTLCQHAGNGLCDPNQPVLPHAPQYLNDGRQFFLKASYLLRF